MHLTESIEEFANRIIANPFPNEEIVTKETNKRFPNHRPLLKAEFISAVMCNIRNDEAIQLHKALNNYEA